MSHADPIDQAAAKIAEIACGATPSQVLITSDLDDASLRVALRVARCIAALGSKPVLAAVDSTDHGSGELIALGAAVAAAPIWVDLSSSLIDNTRFYGQSEARGQRVLILCGADEDLLVRGLGAQDLGRFGQFARALECHMPAGCQVHVSSDAGSDFRFVVAPEPVSERIWVFPGQANFHLAEGSAEGVLVVDGSIFPPAELGSLREALALHFHAGRVTDVVGRDGALYRRWLAERAPPERWLPQHFSFGFNPGFARPRGNMLEDERIWGAINLGIGLYADGWHSDTVVLRATVSADARPLLRDGRYVDPTLIAVFGRS
jgi:leucyl aminopeptidase (aminopeptidase T)